MEVTAADAGRLSSRGGILGDSTPQIPIKPGPQQDIAPNSGSSNGGSSGGGSSSSSEVGSNAGGSEGTDEITSIPDTPPTGPNPPSNDGEGGDETQTVIAKPTGVAPKVSDPGFIGNVAWTTPGKTLS